MRPRLILAANATPGHGGQGLNLRQMIEGLGGDFDLTVFCQTAVEGNAPVSDSCLARWILSVPVLRRLRDHAIFLRDTHFDREVARRLPAADLFQGAVGQCLESLSAARRRGAATVLDSVTCHVDQLGEVQARECPPFGVRPALHPGARDRVRKEYEAADLIRVMSDVAARSFLERGCPAHRIAVARPFFDVAEFPQATFRSPTFRVCFVGLIEPWKGFHYLIQAFHQLALADSELVLWGGPGARGIARYLREQMARNPAITVRPVSVRSVGYDHVYAASSVLVQPSLSDGFGYVVGEAMACGIPVIVTSTAGASDVVVDGANGYIVPPGDADAICERLRHLAAHPALLREMGRRAREAVRPLSREEFRRVYPRRLEALACAN